MKFIIEFEGKDRDQMAPRLIRAVTELRDRINADIKLHGSARTTPEQRSMIRRAPRIHGVQEHLAKELNVNPKTIKKWMERDSILDKPMGPPRGRSRVITEKQEQAILTHCRVSKGSLDHKLADLKEEIPQLTRSTLNRVLKRNSLNFEQQVTL